MKIHCESPPLKTLTSKKGESAKQKINLQSLATRQMTLSSGKRLFSQTFLMKGYEAIREAGDDFSPKTILWSNSVICYVEVGGKVAVWCRRGCYSSPLFVGVLNDFNKIFMFRKG